MGKGCNDADATTKEMTAATCCRSVQKCVAGMPMRVCALMYYLLPWDTLGYLRASLWTTEHTSCTLLRVVPQSVSPYLSQLVHTSVSIAYYQRVW